MEITKQELALGIFSYSNVLDNPAEFISYLENSVASGATAWTQPMSSANGVDVVDYEARNLDILGVPYDSAKALAEQHESDLDRFNNTAGNILFTALDPIERDYQQAYDVEITWHDTYNVLRYGKGHFFGNHIDDGTVYHRTVSIIYYANDDYTGGEINFPRLGLSYKPKANEALVFPSNFMYNHFVSPIIDGYRYAVASWMH